MPEDQAETLAGRGSPVIAVRTPDTEDGPFGDLDTARLRNVIARRVFGETIDPVRIGRYPTLRRIGQGGMGVVYAAYDNELDRRIAIKLLWRGDVQDEAEAARMRARMLREARALAQLSDPSIVQIYEAGEHEGHVFLAMEFVEGPTLRQWVESERRSVAEVLDVFAQAGRGLAAAHAAGLVHRDFKPENVVIGADGRVRVLDFGVALTTRTVQEPELADPPAANDDARLTMTGALIGTPAYMAPEQIDRSRAADARSDQFSFAVALFEALYGRRPFVGGSLNEVVAATLAGRIDIPTGRRVPGRITRALRRALAREPGDRFVAMDALLRELDARTRTLRFVGVAAAALTVTTAGWLGVRAENFASEAATANERADTAELELRAREDAIIVGEANLELFRDPSAALRKLAELPDDAAAWHEGAWQIAARAIDAGVADRVLAVPHGFSACCMIDEQRAVLKHGFDTAIWHLDTGLVDLIDPGDRDGLDFSEDATWVAIARDDHLRIRHVDTGVEGHWKLGECDASQFTSDAPELGLYCDGAERSITWNTPTGPDDPLVIREGGSATLAGALDLHRAMSRTVAEAVERRQRRNSMWYSTPDGRSFDHLASRGELSARVERTHHDASDPLVLWNHATDHGRTVALPATPVTATFSRSGNLLAVGVNDGGIWLVDLRDPALAVTSFAKLDSGIVDELAFSRDGDELCGIAKDGTVVRWDVDDREERARLRGLTDATACFWHDDGSFVALGHTEYRHYPAPTLRRITEDVLQIAGARDGLATLDRRGGIDVAHDGRMIEVATVPSADELALSPDARWVATSGERSLEIRDVEAGTLRERIETRNQSVAPLFFTEDSSTLVWLDRNAIQLHPIDGGTHRAVQVPGDGFWGTPITDGDALLAIYAPALTGDAELVTVEPQRAEIVQRVPLSIRTVRRIATLPDGGIAAIHDGEHLVVLERDGSLRWELCDESPGLLDVIALAGGRGLATIDFEGTVAIWDERTGVGYEAPFGNGHGTAVHGGRHRLEHGATLALDERGALWVVDRSGLLVRYRIDVPWPGAELASWVRARSG